MFGLLGPTHPYIDKKTSENVKSRTSLYTPDYLVLGESGPVLIQCKTAIDAYALTKSHPNDWTEKDGVFTFEPASISAVAYGLAHKVFTPAASTEILVSNLKLLMQSRLWPQSDEEELLKKVKNAFGKNAFVTVKALWERCNLDSLCPLWQLIDRGVLFARLSDDLLDQHESALIAAHAEYLPALEKVERKSASEDVSTMPRENELERALKNYEKLKRNKAPKRTLRYWRNKIKKLEGIGQSVLLRIAPGWSRSGNWGSKVLGIRAGFIAKFITDNYPANYKIVAQRSYEQYRKAAQQFHPHEPPVGREAFKARVFVDPVAEAEAIGGKRAANQAQPSSDVEVRTLRPRRAFELAHIDHYNTDVHLCIKINGKKAFTIRVWLTVMVDAFSEAVLAFWISSKAPSRRACAMILRRCLRVHGRLPESIITDRGAEFESTYYSALLAHCQICKKERPAGHGRYGSEAERLFKLFIGYYLSTRPGRIRSIIRSRGISRSHSSQATAQLTPSLFVDEVTGFFDWYNNVNITSAASAPSLVRLNESAALIGCCGIPTNLNHDFLIASAVEFDDYTIDTQRGINTSKGWYFNPAIGELAGKRAEKLIAREDPEFPHRIYVLLKNRWVTFRHTLDKGFDQMTENQQLVSALRINDGQSAKAAQREYANGLLAKQMVANNEALAVENAQEVQESKEIRSDRNTNNAFAAARNTVLKPLGALIRRAS